MTATVTDRRAEAADTYRASLLEGAPLTGRELGDRFGLSRSWGRDVIRDAVAVDRGNGSHPVLELSASPDVGQPPPLEVAATEPPQAATAQPRRPWYDNAVTGVVALVAFLASYGHMYDVALSAGEPLWIARAWPITVDGLAFAALRRGEAGKRWLALSLLISVAANVVAQFPELAATVGPAVSGWPPLALYGTHRLLHGRHMTTTGDT